jgi:hypothetical protein
MDCNPIEDNDVCANPHILLKNNLGFGSARLTCDGSSTIRITVIVIDESATGSNEAVRPYTNSLSDIEFASRADKYVICKYKTWSRLPRPIEFEVGTVFQVASGAERNLVRPSDVNAGKKRPWPRSQAACLPIQSTRESEQMMGNRSQSENYSGYERCHRFNGCSKS